MTKTYLTTTIIEKTLRDPNSSLKYWKHWTERYFYQQRSQKTPDSKTSKQQTENYCFIVTQWHINRHVNRRNFGSRQTNILALARNSQVLKTGWIGRGLVGSGLFRLTNPLAIGTWLGRTGWVGSFSAIRCFLKMCRFILSLLEFDLPVLDWL